MNEHAMHTQFASSRAECAYCGAQARPNSMYCMNCGQIILAPRATEARTSMQSALVADTHAHPPVAGATSKPQTAQPASRGMEQYLLPAVPALPELPVEPAPAVTQASQARQTSLASQELPGAASPLVAPPPRPKLASADARVFELALPDGTRIKVDGTAVLGRRPEATARNSGAQAIVIPDDSKSVSRAHAVIELHGAAAAVSDAGSANGSSVERDGSVLALRSSRQISLRHGDRIWLGNVPVDVHITHRTAEEAQL